MATQNETLFYERYVIELTAEITKHPDRYFYPVDKVPDVAQKMVAALKRGSGNKDSNAIRRTCKALDVKYTYAALHAYLNA